MTQQELIEEQHKTNLYGLFSICQDHSLYLEVNYNRFKLEWDLRCSFDNKQLNYHGELDRGVKWMLGRLESYGLK